MTITLGALPHSAEFQFEEVAAGSSLRPAWGGPIQPMGRTGDRWAVTVDVPVQDASDCGGDLRTDLSQGRLQTVILAIPEAGTPATYGATPLVNGGGQLGTTLNIDGLTPGVVIRKNKWLNIVIGGRHSLYEVRAAVTANGAGQAAVPIWPMIRRSPADNAAVRLDDPVIEGFGQMEAGFSARRFGDRVLTALRFRVEERE